MIEGMEDDYAKKKDHGLSDCGVAYGVHDGMGAAVPAVADVSVTQPDQDSSSHATVLGYGNLLCRLFPKLDGCRKQ